MLLRVRIPIHGGEGFLRLEMLDNSLHIGMVLCETMKKPCGDGTPDECE